MEGEHSKDCLAEAPLFRGFKILSGLGTTPYESRVNRDLVAGVVAQGACPALRVSRSSQPQPVTRDVGKDQGFSLHHLSVVRPLGSVQGLRANDVVALGAAFGATSIHHFMSGAIFAGTNTSASHSS